MHIEFCLVNLKVRDLSGHVGVVARLILKFK
jgi:hypothetical protein